MWKHLLLITVTTAQQLVYKYNVSCDNATNTLVKDERRDANGDWVGEWVEPGGGAMQCLLDTRSRRSPRGSIEVVSIREGGGWSLFDF